MIDDSDVLDPLEVNCLHDSADTPFTCAHVEITGYFVLLRIELPRGEVAVESLRYGIIAIIRNVDVQRMPRPEHEDAVNTRAISLDIVAVDPPAIAHIRQSRLDTGQSESSQKNHSAAIAMYSNSG